MSVFRISFYEFSTGVSPGFVSVVFLVLLRKFSGVSTRVDTGI